MRRLALVVVVACLALAGLRPRLFHVSVEQQRQNLAAWRHMDQAERETVRQAWRRLSALQGPQRERILRRLATVSRLLARHRQYAGTLPTHDELLAMLAAYPDRLAALLDRQGLPQGPLAERLRARTRRLVVSFLQGLSEQGRLDPGQRPVLEALPYPQLVVAALDLKKREEIYLLAEGTAPQQTVEVARLSELNPLEVVEQLRETRRRRGLLGRASRCFGLTEADRSWLSDVSDEDLVKALRSVYEPKVRAHLESKGWAPEEIVKILTQPFRKLERTLDRIEREGR